jgi:type II secretory pathway component PulM
MFEAINEQRVEPRDRKMLLMKIGAFVVALAVLGGVIYLFTFAH